MAGDKKLLSALETTLALSKQLVSSLSLTTAETSTASEPDNNTKNPPLPLLSASAQALKSHTTKLSLLAINSPFTPSAITTVLFELNASILPSLVTAALLATAERYTQTFKTDVGVLVKCALRELNVLVSDVKNIALRNGEGIGEEEKSAITTITGRVWKACDQLDAAAADGVVGLVIKKAAEYLELVKDGVRELEEWDPEESDDDDDMWNDGFDDDRDNINKGEDEDEDGDEIDAELLAKLKGKKKDLLRLLSPVSKMYSSIITNRLKKLDESSILPAYASQLDLLVGYLREIPNSFDEAAGSLYEHNIESAEVHTRKLREYAVAAVEVVRVPWRKPGATIEVGNTTDQSEQGDKFSRWAVIWYKVLEELGKPMAVAKSE